jgi:hypothetical protein
MGCVVLACPCLLFPFRVCIWSIDYDLVDFRLYVHYICKEQVPFVEDRERGQVRLQIAKK